MKVLGIGLLVVWGLLAPCRDGALAETPHPLTYWVRATIDPVGPAAWSITVRTGGYYTGYALWIDGEFNGQLSSEQRAELSRALDRLPRKKRAYSFGTEQMEGPNLVLELETPGPMTRFRIGEVSERERDEVQLEAVSQAAELLVRLVPGAEGRAGAPWRETPMDEPRGRTKR
jgi:hypothetical protein